MMGRAGELTAFERRTILRHFRAGLSYGKIAAAVGRSKSSVERVVKAGVVEKPPTKRGATKKLDPRTQRHIIRSVVNDRSNSKKVREELQLTVSVRTVQRTIADVPWMRYMKLRRARGSFLDTSRHDSHGSMRTLIWTSSGGQM